MSVFNVDIFPFEVAELAETSPEGLDITSGASRGSGRQKPHQRDLCPLLRLGGKAKRKEHGTH
jgi:hypothetical protein